MATTDETAADTHYWHFRLNKWKTLFWLLALVILTFVTALAKFGFGEYGKFEQRAKLSEVFVLSSEARKSIAQQLENDAHSNIPANTADLIPTGVITYKTVANDGTLVVFSQQTGTLIVSRPQVGADGKIEWTCWGGSAYGNKALPSACRLPEPRKPESYNK